MGFSAWKATLTALLALLFSLELASTSLAQIVFEPGTGGAVSGEVVRGALGWEERQFRRHAAGVVFSYEMTDWYAVTCTIRTVEKPIVTSTSRLSHSTTIGVESKPQFEMKEGRRQISGYDLLGFGEKGRGEGSVPMVGDPCEGPDGDEGRVSRVELEHVRDVLFVNHGEMRVGLWSESY